VTSLSATHDVVLFCIFVAQPNGFLRSIRALPPASLTPISPMLHRLGPSDTSPRAHESCNQSTCPTILTSDLHFERRLSTQIRCNKGRIAAPFCRPTFTAADPAAHGRCHETRIQRPCLPCSANARPVTCGRMLVLRCTDTYSTRHTQRHRDCTLHHTPQHTPGLGACVNRGPVTF